MKTAIIILFVIGALALAAAFALPLILSAAAPQNAGVGIIGGSDAPTYTMLFKTNSTSLLIAGGAVITSAVILLIVKKKDK